MVSAAHSEQDSKQFPLSSIARHPSDGASLDRVLLAAVQALTCILEALPDANPRP